MTEESSSGNQASSSHDQSRRKAESRPKKVLAALLTVTLLVATGRMAFFLWKEGDGLCRALQGGLESVPTAGLPCSTTSYAVGGVDWDSVQATRTDAASISVHYQFDGDGDILRLESDRGDDGSVEVTYRCTMLGKILMPMTNYAAWSSYSTITGLMRAGKPRPRQVSDEGGDGVGGLHTQLTVLGDPARSGTHTVVAATRDQHDRLRSEVEQSSIPGRLTMSDYEYDGHGNLSSRRRTVVSHPHTVTRQTDYRYHCRE